MRIAIMRVTVLALMTATSGVIAPPVAAQPSREARSNPGDVAAAQLDRIGSPNAHALARAMRAADWNIRRPVAPGRFFAPGAVDPLLIALRDRRPVVKRIALWGLSELRAKEARSAIIPFLDDRAPEVRAEAARALGDIEATGEAARIAALLRDPHPFVRVQAAHALGDLQHPATRPALEAALRDTHAGVRSRAAWALARVAESERIVRRHGRRR